jgi:hypothetical protein
MKIALLYSGLPNMTELIYNNHKKYIIDHYDCDIYLSTYNIKNYETCINLLKPKITEIENWEILSDNFKQIAQKIVNKKPETIAINTLSMFYKIKQCFGLIDSNINYDAIIRIRLDNTFNSKLDIVLNEDLNIPKGGDYGGILDQFAYGSFYNMQIYCHLYSQIQRYIETNCVIFHPETILKYYLLECNVNIQRFFFNIYLRNSLFTR